MKRRSRACRWRHHQRGATAVEFAIVFPLFFMIFYAIVSFGMVFVIQQSLTFAVSEGARAGLNYAPSLGSDQNHCTSLPNSLTRTQNACNTALGALGWLNGNPQPVSVTVKTNTCSAGSSSLTNCLTVTVSYSPLQWLTTMPFLGQVLSGPLTSSAVVQIPQSML
ncbi:pilus assembly protein [Burkholderia sp. Bp8994]|uniref:TadE/TadG family type IV pilus assembly protein n=1 Tax=unclassified Burkholderia TaxID=2613784 RepID=UPI000F55F2CD|nr:MULTISPECIES: TadE/TadG family type IV pilus assembly protein [unclassified Burkholderia]RQR37478.1 pilus assembly protein [Burkholderia sp. Bp9131]RQR67517.1 pilus assembly protein [Burkholderia sp. Bp9015]RQS00116.1 pilus assembly protein [Burkholderia sp. Bp8994]RQS34334.1 pilus assembly protein [Burkholderia sp. Bp8990]RQZ38972.1 pilus assembly protein [Burkholderia sp. Bp9099]